MDKRLLLLLQKVKPHLMYTFFELLLGLRLYLLLVEQLLDLLGQQLLILCIQPTFFYCITSIKHKCWRKSQGTQQGWRSFFHSWMMDQIWEKKKWLERTRKGQIYRNLSEMHFSNPHRISTHGTGSRSLHYSEGSLFRVKHKGLVPKIIFT